MNIHDFLIYIPNFLFIFLVRSGVRDDHHVAVKYFAKRGLLTHVLRQLFVKYENFSSFPISILYNNP